MGERERKPGWAGRIGRILAVVLVFLLIGAVVNVLVAWSVCVSRPGNGWMSWANYKDLPDWPHAYGARWGRPFHADRSVSWDRTVDRAHWNDVKIAVAELVGLPFRALKSGCEADRAQYVSVSYHVWSFQTRWLQGTLPFRPLWPGFALNTLIYAGLAWGLWQLPFAARRWRRKRRNQCLACGYSRAGLAESSACPECGAVGK